jgi:hypothetical protein
MHHDAPFDKLRAQGMRAEEAANKFALSSSRAPMPAAQAIVMLALHS